LQVRAAADRAGTPTSGIGILAAITLNIAVSIAVQAKALEAFRIPSTGLAPTITLGDHIYINKLTTRWQGSRAARRSCSATPRSPVAAREQAL